MLRQASAGPCDRVAKLLGKRLFGRRVLLVCTQKRQLPPGHPWGLGQYISGPGEIRELPDDKEVPEADTSANRRHPMADSPAKSDATTRRPRPHRTDLQRNSVCASKSKDSLALAFRKDPLRTDGYIMRFKTDPLVVLEAIPVGRPRQAASPIPARLT
ncbi:uncharacterized protein PG986_008586 [Apiospora aurea]|uniref:Uncharacterized protein n=1 Tax=Apiospora aurea TaxID=335848 RepID=A0ABR1Q5A0_9PEZI